MAEEIAFENGRISNFEGFVTMTWNQIILHTVVHTYMPNFVKIEEKYVPTHGWTFETGFIRSTLLKSRPNEMTS